MISKSVFSTKTGRALASELVAHIARTEPFQNQDECIDEIRGKLCLMADTGYGVPVSALFLAEDQCKLKKRRKTMRYQIHVKINDN